jgi:eukaryotic-like serine/threonine-protein kinase
LRTSVKQVFFAVFLCLLMVPCNWTQPAGASSTDNWSMFNHDLAHTGYSTSSAPKTNQTLWTFTAGDAVKTSPAIVDGIVYFGSDDGYVYALNAANGSLIWKYNTNGPVQSSPAIVNGVVYIGGYHSHSVFALNAYTGALIWQASTESVYPLEISSVAVSNGLVYVDTTFMGSGCLLYAFDASTGNLTWNHKASGWTWCSPVISGNKVYWGYSSRIECLDAKTGESIWNFGIMGNGNSPNSSDGTYSGTSSFSSSNGILFIGTWRENIQAWDASTGKYLWSGNTKGSVDRSTPTIANGVIYASTSLGGTQGRMDAGGVSAVDAKTGASLWNTTVGSIRYSSPAVAGGLVFVGTDIGPTSNPSLPQVTDHGLVYAFDAATGKTVWKFATGGDVYSSPAVAYGVVYVGSNDGKVYAFGSSTAQIPTPSSVSSSVPTSTVTLTPSNTSPSPTPPVPEFPSIILPLLAVLSLVSVGLFRKRRTKL